MAETWKTYVDGRWVDADEQVDVIDKYSGEIFAKVPKCDRNTVEDAILSAKSAFADFKKYPAHKKAEILEKAYLKILDRQNEMAEIICKEAGKAWKYSLNEVLRGAETFKFAAEEAKRIHGETIPLDASKFGENRRGYYFREPLGVVGAITPFNFPLNLVGHKVAPAIAAGNSVVLKPASTTPVTSLVLAEILEDSGLPKGVFNVVIGSGSVVGDMIVTHPECKKISFTGSPEVGDQITKKAGIKKVTLELGNNSATVIDEDADLKKAAARCAASAFANSGQVCISLQRIYVHKNVTKQFEELFVKEVNKLKFGNPLEKDCDVGPMIEESEAERAETWIKEAVKEGAQIIAGGKREGRMFEPTVLTDVTDEMKVMCMEVFAPVVSIVSFDDYYEAVKLVENSDYGLQAGIYTNDIKKAYHAIDNLNVGGVMINDTSIFRVDHMPYGGNKMSGIGREGVKFAIEDMTDIKMVVFNIG